MTNRKLKIDEVDDRLSLLNIKRVDDYITTKISIRFECLICKYIWKAIPNNIFQGSGCPKCSGKMPLSNEDVDFRIKDKGIIRIEDYCGALSPIQFQCLSQNCNYVWKARPSDIFNSVGCPKCYGKMKLSNEEVDNRLIGRNIKRIGNFTNSHVPIDFQCKICYNIWKTYSHHILNRNTGCPRCSSTLSNEEVDNRLIGRNIKRIDKYEKGSIPIRFQCQICNNIWKARPFDIFHNQSGCPKCNTRKNEKLVLKIFEENETNPIHQKRLKEINNLFPNFRVDFYFPKINVIVEYNGIQHYKPVRFGNRSQEDAEKAFKKQIKRDEQLKTVCQEYKIQLICIDGRNYYGSKLEKYLIEKIIPLIKEK